MIRNTTKQYSLSEEITLKESRRMESLILVIHSKFADTGTQDSKIILNLIVFTKTNMPGSMRDFT